MELLVVGFDGLSFNMLGEFDISTPFMDSVRAEGFSGDLRSVDTPTTIPAWTSFATGRDPGSHGVPTMLKQSADYAIAPATCNTTDAAIYDFVDDGLFVNLPASIERIPAADDTYLISSFLASSKEAAVPDVLQSLDAYADYVVHADVSRKSKPENYFEHLLETTRARYAFAAEAFDQESPRVGFVLFSTPDWVGHHLQLSPNATTRARWYRTVVEACDEYAAELASRTENVLLLSDHGFEHKTKSIHLQEWLEQEGYLQRVDDQSFMNRVATGAAKQIARRFDTLFDLLRTTYLRVTNTAGGERLGDLVDLNPDIDFPISNAWQLRYGCLYINDSRFDSPNVEKPERLRTELVERLSELTDADGDRVFESVHVPEEVYVQPDPEARLPDVIARPASGYLPLRAFSPTGDPVIDSPGYTRYDHRYRGFVAASGPMFEEGLVEGMSIVDVLPTLLHALNEPLAPDFDGQVRRDFLTTPRKPSRLAPNDVPVPRQREKRSNNSEAVAREHLRDLGYLE